MQFFIIKILVLAVSIYFVGKATKLYYIEGFFAAVITALILSVINTIIRPGLIVIAFLPIILTFGIFMFFVNGFCLYLASKFVMGFKIEGCLYSAIASLIISVVNMILEILLL